MPTKTKAVKKPRLTPLEALEQAAECLKTLAHPHRLRMVQMLLQGRYTVGELARKTGVRRTIKSPSVTWPTSWPASKHALVARQANIIYPNISKCLDISSNGNSDNGGRVSLER